MVKVMDKPHKTVLKIAGFEDKDTIDVIHFPTTRRELLDKLQVHLVVFPDRIEMKAIFTIAPITYQDCTSTSQGEGD